MSPKSKMSIVLTASILLILIFSDADAQKNRKSECKYLQDNIDAFTKERTVLTDQAGIFDIKEFSIGDIALGQTGRVFMVVKGSIINRSHGLKFQWCAFKKDWIAIYDKIDLLMADGEVIILNDETASEISFNGTFYQSDKLITISNDSTWSKLKSIPIRKIKLSLNNKDIITSDDIDKKYNTAIIDVINCIDILGIPTRPNGMTSDEALLELKKCKDKLDLGIITQSKYDSIKAEYTKFIN